MVLRLLLALTAAATLLAGCGERAPETAKPAATAEVPAPSNTAVAETPSSPPLVPPKLQLPTGVTPLAYQLDLTVIPERETFSGRVRIDIRFDTGTDGFWIHGRGLDVDSVKLHATEGTIDGRYQQVTPDGVVRISLARSIAPQTAQLDISYHGRFSSLLEGLFRAQVDGDWYAFTQFEPIDARGAFPGFDEPRFKTPYTVSIVAPKAATVAANSPVAQVDSLPDGTQRVQFDKTPPLPTYLVAFTVGPLDVVEGGGLHEGRAGSAPLRGLAAKGRGPQFAYAMANTPEIVGLLEDYFAQPYPFAKLDLVAVPSQQGAMENVGLVTYGEYTMLLDQHPPLSQQREFANVNAHELAHQWFGDSVTMRWWDDVWLNEAFATLMSSKIVQAWRPSYRAAESQILSALQVMNLDALASARRIREPIESFNDITNAFDDITYEKGAGVLNMVDGFIGETTFRDGVRAHLRNHAGGSADMNDLVASLVEASGRAELGGIVDTFTNLPGTPFVDVQLHCDGQRPSVTLTQQRYLPLGSKASADQQWNIPVCMRIGVVDGVREQCTVLTQHTMDVALDVDGCPTWLMPNRGGRGYYRWHLDETRLDRLTSVMYSALDPGERLALADGLVAGVESGDANLAAYFERVPQLLKSNERYLLMSPMPLWRTVQIQMLNDADRSVSRERIRTLYGPVLGELARRGITSDEDRLTQSSLINVLATDGRDPKLRSELTNDALAFVGFGTDGALHRDKLDVNLVNVALRVAAQDADPKFAAGLVDRLKDTDDVVLRVGFLSAIGAANDPTLAQKLALDESIRNDDYLNLVGSMFWPEQAERTWPWFAANIDALLEKTPTFQRGALIDVTGTYCTTERAAAVAALFEPRLKRIDGGRRVLDQALERINLCVALRTAYASQAHDIFH